MPKHELRWVELEHTGTTGEYLLVDCPNEDCGMTSTLVALVEGVVHLRAERKCQHCGQALDVTDKALDAAIRDRSAQRKKADAEPEPAV